MGAMRNSYILVRKSEVKRPLGRPRCIWENNIKTDLKDSGCDDVEWIHLAQGSNQWKVLVHAVMNLWVP
jgi:hypothetical protein